MTSLGYIIPFEEINVLNIIIPMLTLLLAFLSALSSLRFFLTRLGRIYWIIPFFISLILFYQNIKVLIEYADSTQSYPVSFDTILPLVLNILWYSMIIAFHYALKTEREYNKYVEESRRTYNEARFIALLEKRQTKKEDREKKIESNNRSRKVEIKDYDFPETGR